MSELFSETGLFSWKRFGSEHCPDPFLWPSRKRHCILCGRLFGSGWGGRIRPVVMIGFSLGGGLSMMVAKENLR